METSVTLEKICVIGLGYIGLPTASILATKGFQVCGVDINPQIVEIINSGKIHIHEPGLDTLVKSAVLSGNLKASLEPQSADVFLIAVPTPLQAQHHPDISYIKSAVWALAPYLVPGNLVILESTSPVGTTEKIAEWIEQLRPDLIDTNANLSILIAHCPERVLPGRTLEELIGNDRIIGGINSASAERARIFYHKFVSGDILLTDARTAEMCKLTENAFRDVNIAFANELSMICDELNINVWELISLANRHPRVNILQPGPGVGGHCIAVDPWFIVDSAPNQAQLIRTAREVNDKKLDHVLDKIKEKAISYGNPVIACLGLAFKANIDDLRESPAVKIVQQLAEAKIGRILAVEPHIKELPQSLQHLSVTLASLETALVEADLIVILVNHKAFYKLDREELKKKAVIDTRGILENT
jgi:UDP-N-acetyl-D-mannosaminuronic acid dehydrogenase